MKKKALVFPLFWTAAVALANQGPPSGANPTNYDYNFAPTQTSAANQYLGNPTILAQQYGNQPVRMDPDQVGGLPVLSFGFSVEVLRNSLTKSVLRITVSGVAQGSQALAHGLVPYTQIVSIDGKPVEDFTASFAQGSELNKKLMHRKRGDQVILEILPPGARESRFVALVDRS
jgi:hypothetical protein